MMWVDRDASNTEPVAVIGLACRLPTAPDPDEYWRLLREGRDAVTDIPANRWGNATAEFPAPRRGGFLDRVDAFDSDFFAISPREAAAMDPQQRLMLELSWEALEDSGIIPASLTGASAGVFVGAIWDDYATLTFQHGVNSINQHTVTGVHRSIIANRVSYLLGAHGPSVVVDTGQSSSLVAVHMACESLRRGEAALALAGGVNLIVVPESTVAAERFGGLSPDGRCFTFDARANGFVRGEGAGVVVLKPLAAAVADGDPVYCVILSSAVNNDGATDGLTVPSAQAQASVVRLAHSRAGIPATDVQYVELHGTGTRRGDPIEAAALGDVFGGVRARPLLVGSVKTNIGHLEGAAGIAGLIKTALSISRRELPASLNFSTPHPDIPLDALNLEVQASLGPWPRPEASLLAGVSSFGMGGTNCHVVLREGPAASQPRRSRRALPVIPWVLSARSPQALSEQAARLSAQASRLSEQGTAGRGPHPADVAFSLATTRSAFEHRAVVLGANQSDLDAGVADLAAGRPSARVVQGRVTGGKLAFLFPGQGSQRAGMTQGLYTAYREYARTLDLVCANLDPQLPVPLKEVMFAEAGSAAADKLDQTLYTQAALFASELALFRLLEHWGVRPDYLLGHSVGELAAAQAAGALSLEDACGLVLARGRLMQSVAIRGAMAAIQASPDEIGPMLAGREDKIAIAAVNGPAATVVSGDADEVRQLAARWRDRGRKTKQLQVSHAFHSPHMDGILDAFGEVAQTMRAATPAIPVISNLTGVPLTESDLRSGDYWVRHVRGTVRFLDGMRWLRANEATVFLELGPNGALTAMGRECLADDETGTVPEDAAVIPALRGGWLEPLSLVTAVAQAHVHGVGVDWPALTVQARPRRVRLPTYAFQRRRHWLRELGPREPRVLDTEGPAAPAEISPVKGEGDTLELVRTHTAIVLGHDTPDAVAGDRTFKDLGFGSLASVELCGRLSTATGLPLPDTLLYSFPTPSELARHLSGLLSGAAREAEPRLGAYQQEAVAIVGMGCRYPGGAHSPEDIWRMVAERTDAIGEFPANRGWDLVGLYDPDRERQGTSYTRNGGFLYDADLFDPEFFGIGPREAAAMDPQQRLLLEISWEALERAGIAPDSLRGSPVGVFAGATYSEYGPRLYEASDGFGGYLLTGQTPSVISGRVAYALGLEGPAVTIDTACSSSLVAIHLAARALRQGECSLALAGGCTVMAGPGMFVEFSRQSGLAPDGRCKAFAAGADGTGWSEGAGMLVLERLSDARKNGHQVLAVIRGSAINQDGASNGLTAPNGRSQERVISQALTDAGLTIDDVQVVEAHGTGTTLGDPIEAQALVSTYGRNRSYDSPLYLGSLKSNIGHTQAAAGVGGIIKMVMALRHETMPATLHVDEPSPHVDWADSGLELLTEPVPWPADGHPRRAGVSSFGISGTNAHLIIEEAPGDRAAPRAADERPRSLPWVLSAHTPAALRDHAQQLLDFTSGSTPEGIRDIGWSLATGRATLPHRAVLIGSGPEDFRAGLAALAQGETAGSVASGNPEVVFVFPGQGARWPGMAAGLLADSAVFASVLEDCSDALEPHTGWSLIDRLDDPEVARPALWAVMVALAALWRSYGVEPAAVVGHGEGEIAAACVAGALSLEDAAGLVARGDVKNSAEFEDALRALATGGHHLFIEVSPHPTLTEAIQQTLGEATPVAESLRRDDGGTDRFLASLVSVYAAGVPVRWSQAFAGSGARRADLPTYPFQRRRYWLNDPASGGVSRAGLTAAGHGLLAASVEVADGETLVCTGRIDLSTHPWLAGHSVLGSVLLPGAAFAELALAAGALAGCERVDELTVTAPLVLTGHEGAQLQVSVAGQDDRGRRPISISSRSDGGTWIRHATGVLSEPARSADGALGGAWPPPGAVAVSVAGLYERLAEHGYDYGPEFQCLRAAWRLGDDILCEVGLADDQLAAADNFGLHPALLDAALHPVVALLQDPANKPLPFAWHGVQLNVSGATELRVRISPAGRDGVALKLADADGGPVGSADLVTFRQATADFRRPADGSGTLYRLAWTALPAPDPALASHGRWAWIGTAPDSSPADSYPDLASLTAAIESGAAEPDTVVAECPSEPADDVPGGVRAAVDTTLALLREWLAQERLRSARLVVLTRHAVVTGEGAPDLPGAAVVGLLRTARAENPTRIFTVDLDDQDASLRALPAAAATGEPELAIREGTLYAPRLRPTEAPSGKPAGGWGEGTVLITGGTGTLGRLIARHLAASHGVRHLLLTSRRGPHAPDAEGLIAELAALGAHAVIASCDVADRGALADLLATIPPDHKLAAVVHAAGALDDGLLQSLSPDRVATVLRPKVDAAWHLHELTRALDLQAFILFSSVTATIGNPGQASYTAANAFMDGLAQHRRSHGLAATSLAWGLWAEASGMTGQLTQADLARLARQGIAPMPTDQCLSLFSAAIADATSLAAVTIPARLDMVELRAQARSGDLLPVFGSLVPRVTRRATRPASLGSAWAQKLAALPGDEQERQTLELVRSHAAAVLGHAAPNAVETDRAFTEIGLDSLGSVELQNRLTAATGLRLAASAIFDYPTVRTLAAHVRARAAGTETTEVRPAVAVSTADDPIVITSMSCRYPGGVRSPDDLWRLVAEGRDAITEFPADRGWDIDDLYDPDPDRHGKTYSKHGGFIDDPGGFDPGFFGMSPRESLATDPQQRILLELAWEAIERAGIDHASLRGSRTGVFVGVMYDDYSARITDASIGFEGYLATAVTSSVASGRIAYCLGLEGPAVTIDTACSSSLVALHQACQAIRNGDCDLALAGGATVMATPRLFLAFSRQRGLSPDGRCKAFATAADGTGWSEGAGLLLVERLSQARRNGHPVLAVVCGSAVNQDGASNGLTAPNGPSQQRVIRQALASAGLSPEDIDVIEAHGTGTPLGDPIEAQAIIATYGHDRPDDRPVRLGSVKSNFGHTQAAAGVAGIIKMVMAMRHGELPRSLHIDQPSAHVDWAAGAVSLLTEPAPWPTGGRPRRAGVSSFGISGTNAHVILEQPADPAARTEGPDAGAAESDALAWPISARDDLPLRELAGRLRDAVIADPALPEADVAHALATRRQALTRRAVVVGRARADMLAGLEAVRTQQSLPGVVTGTAGQPGKTVFVFPGQGAQWIGMATQLLGSSEVFRAQIQECATALGEFTDWSLFDALSGDVSYDRDDVIQPTLFSVMVSLAALWRSLGVQPDAVVGHSQGEISAAYVAGALSLRDAARVVALRSRAIADLAGTGSLLAVALPADETERRIRRWKGRISVAAINGPSSTIASGDSAALGEFAAACDADGIRARGVPVAYASHSAAVERVRDRLLDELSSITPRESSVPFFSTVTAGQLDTSGLEAGYWYRNLRHTVRFAPTVKHLFEQGFTTFVEVSPHPVLTTSVQETLPADKAAIVLETLRRDDGGLNKFLTSAAEGYVRGMHVSWEALVPGTHRWVDLPTYPFQNERYWLTADSEPPSRAATSGHPLLTDAIDVGDEPTLVCTGRLSVAAQPWLADHKVLDTVLLPGTAFAELAIEAGRQASAPILGELTLQAPLALPQDATVRIRVTVGPVDSDGRRPVDIHSRSDNGQPAPWTKHASGWLTATARQDRAPEFPVGTWPPSGARPVDLADAYDAAAARGYQYGPAFRAVRAIWRLGDEIFADVALEPTQAEGARQYCLHPALFDAALHPLVLGMLGGDNGTVMLPFSWSDVVVHATGATAARVGLSVTSAGSVALAVTDTSGAPVASVGSLVLRPISSAQLGAAVPASLPLLRTEWTAARPDVAASGPATTLTVSPAGTDPVAAAHAETARVLAAVQDHLASDTAATLVITTDGGVAVNDGEDVPDLAGAAVWGLIRSAQSEHPGRLVLLDAADPAPDVVAAALATGEPQLAVRGGELFVPRLGVAPQVSAAGGWALEPDGTVLITGGTGVLGGLVARHLVTRHGASRLLLVSRRGAGSGGAEELAAELAALGAEVTIAACDVTDAAELAGLLAAIPENRPLTAVFHLAGVLDDSPIASLTPDRLHAVLHPKVDAAWHLHRLTGAYDLAAFVLFSSAAGTLGTPGQGNYAAGNAFLDALAQHRRASGLPAVSLAWGLWEPASTMTGHLTAADLARMNRMGIKPMTAQEGLALLDAALERPEAALVTARLELAAGGAGAAAAPVVHEATLQARLHGMQPGERDRALRQIVLGKAAAVLGHASAGSMPGDLTFRELGFESLTAVDFRNQLAEATGLRLRASLVWDHPTPDALVKHLLGELLGEQTDRGEASRPALVPTDGEAIAIVGMGCRFPGGVHGPEALWQLVEAQTAATSAFPGDRGWDVDSLYDPDPDRPGKVYARAGSFLHDAAEFDPDFFGMSPREASAADPQQRILLQTAWETLEHAGIDPQSLRGEAVGVFAGVMYSDYGSRVSRPADTEGYLVSGSSGSVASGRIAYTFGLVGPAISVDTACSSSLVAMHLGVQSLRRGECRLALAGGVTVMATPHALIEFSRQHALSPDGLVKAFADSADGTSLSEGAGLLLLERLSDAERNGHRVLAVIRGSAVNQDGASNGLTAPSGPAQERVIRQALADARLEPGDIDAVEAHGTGTTLGDPIEAGAILATYGNGRSVDRPVWLGSVKSNLGHTQAAAGVAGVIKMVMALRRGSLPATLHVEVPSRHVDWTAGGVRLLTASVPWPDDGRPRRAGVSSFGISGTNAHLILEQAAPPEDVAATSEPTAPVIWALSAPDSAGVRRRAAQLHAYLTNRPGIERADVGLALATTRAAFRHRAAVVGATRDELLTSLRGLADGRAAPGLVSGKAAGGHVAMLFGGQGSQSARMGSELYEMSPVYADAFDEVCDQFNRWLDTPLKEVIFAEPGAALLDQTAYTQPALFAVQVALSRLFMSWGVHPDYLAGHSLGELTAAHVAGVFSLTDACALVAARGRLMQSARGDGAMAAIQASELEIREFLPGGTWVAAVNAPGSVVISGDEQAVLAAADAWRARGRKTARLRVSHAFHSAHMDAAAEEFRRIAATVSYAPAQIPVVSGRTGELATADQLTSADYWAGQIRDTVRFSDGIRTLHENGVTTFLELSGKPALSQDVAATLAGPDVIATLRPGRPEASAIAMALARLFTSGAKVRWSAVFPPSTRACELPTYPFLRQRYWLAPSGTTQPQPGPLPLFGVTWQLTPLTPAAAMPEIVTVGGGSPRYPDVAALSAAIDDGAAVPGVVLLGVGGLPADHVVGLTHELSTRLLAELHRWLADRRLERSRLVVVTSGAVCTLPGEVIRDLPATPAWGLIRTAQAEYPGRFVLLDTSGEELSPAVVAAVLATEEPQLALRGGQAYVPRVAEVAATLGQTVFDPEGTTLITGGTGALGGLIARHLVSTHGVRHLLLVSRSGRNAAEAVRLSDELAGLGADVTIASCDVADRDALAELLSAIPLEHPLTAVIHAAGLLDDGLLQALTPARLDAVLRPKVDAAWHLFELTKDKRLSAFALFSSAATLLGQPGQGNYTAANAFLDALAEHMRAEGQPAVSLAWGSWAESRGMAGSLDATAQERLTRTGVAPMQAGQALALFDAALASRHPYVVAARLDRSVLDERARDGSLPAPLRSLVRVPAHSGVPANETATVGSLPPARQREFLLDLVRNEAAAVLGRTETSEIPGDEALLDLGFDSLTTLELRNRLTIVTGLALPGTLTLDYPTPLDLAEYLRTALAGAPEPQDK